MSRIAERHRINKSLAGLPPKSDPQGRVDYVWNRIKAEAGMVTTCQSKDPSKFMVAFPGNHLLQAPTTTTAAPSMASNMTSPGLLPAPSPNAQQGHNIHNVNTNNNNGSLTSSNGLPVSTSSLTNHFNNNADQQQQHPPSPSSHSVVSSSSPPPPQQGSKREKTSGRRASVSVQRLLQYNILSADSLLHAVTRRISTLCAAPLTAEFHSNNNNFMFSRQLQQHQQQPNYYSGQLSSLNHNNNNNTTIPDEMEFSNNNVNLFGGVVPSAPHVELDQQELVEYFKFYNDWHFEDETQVTGDCFTAAGKKVDLASVLSHSGLHNDNEHASSSESSATPSSASASSSASDNGENHELAADDEDGDAAAQSLLRNPERRDETVFRTFNSQQERFRRSLESSLEECIAEDLIANYDRDPAQMRMMEPLLYNKGFHALQLHRLAERLWYSGEIDYSLLLQSVTSRFFCLDIHPAARIGTGVMIDHGTGVVIGETAVVGDNVSMLHNVTLGGTGKEVVDRHPKVGDGVLIGAGANVLGNVTIGKNARIAAGAIVVKNVNENCTVVGVAARELPPRDFGGFSTANTSTVNTPRRAPTVGFVEPVKEKTDDDDDKDDENTKNNNSNNNNNGGEKNHEIKNDEQSQEDVHPPQENHVDVNVDNINTKSNVVDESEDNINKEICSSIQNDDGSNSNNNNNKTEIVASSTETAKTETDEPVITSKRPVPQRSMMKLCYVNDGGNSNDNNKNDNSSKITTTSNENNNITTKIALASSRSTSLGVINSTNFARSDNKNDNNNQKIGTKYTPTVSTASIAPIQGIVNGDDDAQKLGSANNKGEAKYSPVISNNSNSNTSSKKSPSLQLGQLSQQQPHHRKDSGSANPMNAYEPLTPTTAGAPKTSHHHHHRSGSGGCGNYPPHHPNHHHHGSGGTRRNDPSIPPGVSMTYDQFVFEI